MSEKKSIETSAGNNQVVIRPVCSVEAAKFLGISLSYLYKLTHTRQIPFYKRGKMLYFREDQLSAWAFENRIATQQELEQKATDYVIKKGK
jgi:excisionase family DNA binding protein